METGNIKKRQEKEDQAIKVVRCRLVQREQSKFNEKAVFVVRAAVLFLAMASLAGMVISSYSFSCNVFVLYPLLCLYSVVLTWYYERENKKSAFRYLFPGALFVNVLLFVITGPIIRDSFYSVMNDIILQINNTYNGSLELFPQGETTGTYFLSVLFFWLGVFLAKGMIEKQENLQFIFVTFPLAMFSLLGGGRSSKSSLALLLLVFLSITSFAGMSVRKKYWYVEKEEEFSKNKKVSRRIQLRLTLCFAFIGTILMLVSFYGLRPVITITIEKVSQVASPMKVSGLQLLYEILPKISGGKLSFSMEGVGGGVSQGNLGDVSGFSYDNTEALQLTCSRKPQETVYLKGFIGTEYTGSQWLARDTKEFENAVKNWEIQDNSFIYIQNLPFLRMLYAQKILGEDDGSRLNSPIEMSVKRLDANVNYTYVPYQTFLNDYYVMEGDGAVAGQTLQEDVYSWFPVKEYQSAISRWKAQDSSQSVLDDLLEAYGSYVYAADTQVDENAFGELSELCKEKREEWNSKITEEMTEEQLNVIEQEKYSDIKQFIVSTLWSNCTFTTEVWKLPKGEDFVSYFFSEKKRGDSTAFASAAVLMYRMCGIPARYVVGYAAPSSLFIGNGDGTYTCLLQNENAHAWVEIYMPEYGWTPVETTPGFAGTVVDMEVSEADLKEQEQVKEKQDKEEEQKKAQQNQTGNAAIFGKVLMIVLVFVIVLLTLTLRYGFLRRKRRGMVPGFSKEQQIKEVFCSFYQVLQFLGFSKEIDTTTKEFVQEVSRLYPKLDIETLSRYMDLVLQVHYGQKVITKEDIEFSLAMYEALVKQAAAGLKKGKKLLFYYWKAF